MKGKRLINIIKENIKLYHQKDYININKVHLHGRIWKVNQYDKRSSNMVLIYLEELARYRRSPSRSRSISRSISPIGRRHRSKRKYSLSRSRSISNSSRSRSPTPKARNRSRPSSIRSHTREVEGDNSNVSRGKRSLSSSHSRSPSKSVSGSLSPIERGVSKAKSDIPSKKNNNSPPGGSRHPGLVSYGDGSPESHSK